MSQYQVLDHKQQFQQVLLQSPHKSQTVKNYTFEQAQEWLQKQVHQMMNSGFYKSIDVHYGVKNIQYSDVEYYQNKRLRLQAQIQIKNKFIKHFKKVKTQEQLARLQELQKIELNENNQKDKIIKLNAKLLPWIYIKAKKKSPIYGSISQHFSTKQKGLGMFEAKFGYRSPFQKYDQIELNIQTPLNIPQKFYFETGLAWKNNTQFGDLNLSINYANRNLFRGIDQVSKSFMVSISQNQGKQRYTFERCFRNPQILNNYIQYAKNEYYKSSIKYSLNYKKEIENSLQIGDIITGQYSQINSQIGLPILSNYPYLKLQYNKRTYYDIFHLSTKFKNHAFKNLFQNSNIEWNFSSNIFLTKKGSVSDYPDNITMRGFQQYKRPIKTYSNIKTSLKFNIFNYPVLDSIKITPFLYSQLGISLQKRQKIQTNTMFSTGLGLSYLLAPIVQLQVLCPLFNYQSNNIRQPLKFQVRIGVFD